MLSGLTTPGSRSSEFLVACLNVVAQIALASQGAISDGTAARLGTFGAVAYMIARGLAKYEQRSGGGAGGSPPA